MRMESSADGTCGIWSHDCVWRAGPVVSPLNGWSATIYLWDMAGPVFSTRNPGVSAGTKDNAHAPRFRQDSERGEENDASCP